LTISICLMLAAALDGPVWVPLAHFLAEVVDPARVWEVECFAEHALEVYALLLLDETAQVDPDEIVLQVLANGLEPVEADGTTRLGVIWRTIRQVNRAVPGSDAALTPEDYAAVFAETRAFLLDDVRGMERL